MKHSLPFHVVDLPGKGKGVIALRDIQQGELLIREEPLFILPTSTQGNPSVLINRTLAPLSYAQRISFFSLSFMPEDVEGYDAIALATLQTNAISAADGIGIFPTTARLNHGCSSAFNAVYSWRDREQILVVHALKAIRRGEEILTTYTDTKRPRSERRSFLQSHYHFHCSCSVCSLPDALSRKSDDRLTKMSANFQELASWGTEAIDGVKASEIAIGIWHLGEEEGYWSERGRLAADIVHVAAAHSDADSVISWGELAAEWYTYELGSDSDLTISVRHTVANPDSHPAWGTRSRQRIKTLTP
ncbi:SET domain-containing protein [Schizopora paradoxa]|uniref:SET domain-containing protein n=1 Tax=Schizopora paradoxa TaxID=27342 RepID=A0A0H2RM83_9AGAM|nr:SET domain-containing protein [Schizopora paradoxa]